ncbi:MAG TPA: NHLP-related RiPP peptide [Gaiellaceae bacterium]|nr:NHLP-related RiPP peptide [Gaiellaceae bacterium]
MYNETPGPGQFAHITIGESDALDFLDRLATDDAFRDEVAQNPGGVLLAHGIALDAANIPETVTLASKEEIAEFVERERRKKAGARNVLGFAIFYYVLGAMPLVISKDDGAG